ncbi:uncharacterized protein PGTG_09582 [Puccinia graminis f. sp. tritici CRL 75-36-700-3]|uniref:Piwi domain-containing protein n=1 Tax=Puccinia graminis f. sp. tritici (strain CRL 75-36-700-3 / race SCCL) TaxID=418459 RepID=E3KHU4_PUCGT|nr:uncharacterized protein PGTG_09582 [Puccinia graminis f. sp. tritici CRL 75-36-700-3]EFP83869.2 hypothetical protein PGTG_09582 [Puccinia graminis f. sp. tritici CRL 75-36-700-3]
MVMGADVTHPGRDSLEPSIAAVVGSTNRYGSCYAAEFSVQPGRQEIISDLHIMVKQLLIKFYQHNRLLPENLIFYRDGVSEGQFPDVVAKEIPLVRQAINAMGEDERCKLTYIICGKRHHFKFGPTTKDKNHCDSKGNLLPGVVIDTSWWNPWNFSSFPLHCPGG